jgi:hypothetical protein
LQCLGELASVPLELSDLSAKLVVVGFELGAALFELVEQRVGEPSPGDVGAGAEVAGESVAQDGGLIAELADLFAGVGQVGPQALFCDERACREQPGPAQRVVRVTRLPGRQKPILAISAVISRRRRSAGVVGMGGCLSHERIHPPAA